MNANKQNKKAVIIFRNRHKELKIREVMDNSSVLITDPTENSVCIFLLFCVTQNFYL